MTEQQSKAWNSLPERTKELARNLRRTSHIPQYEAVLDLLFGESNLLAPSETNPKFNVGDKVVTTDCSRLYGKGWHGEIVNIVRNYATVRFKNRFYNIMLENLAPDTEQTAEEGEEKDSIEPNDSSAAAVERGIKLSEEVCRKMLDDKVDMEKYRMELAAKIAVAYAEKGRYEPSEIGAKAVEVANGVVERIKESKR